jgi:hypothetical protein
LKEYKEGGEYMSKTQHNQAVSRRAFLKLLSAGGVAATGGYMLYEYAPWLGYEEQANQIRRPFEPFSTSTEQIGELIHYATLAANGHNTQPWKFTFTDKTIDILPDYSRRLRVVDPNERELWISLGCALEYMLVAARATGFTPEVTYPDSGDTIHIQLTTDTPQPDSLFNVIGLRQNTRSEYDGLPITADHLNQMQALPLEPGKSLRYMLNDAELETVLEYVTTPPPLKRCGF